MSGVTAAAPQSKGQAAVDAACLAAITAASALPYLPRLGFYSDDWGLLAAFSADSGGSLLELVGDSFPARPVQGVYLGLLAKLFGIHPLGYHLVNTSMLVACAALLYWLLLRLRAPRSGSFAATLLFLMLPQLSTVRVWYATFQIPLGMALMLLSMHCQLSFRSSRKLGWLAGAIVTALLSVAAYEIFAPLLVGFAAALLFEAWRARGRRNRLAIVSTAVVVAMLVVAAIAYKYAVSGRTGAIGDPQRYAQGLRQLFRVDYDWRVDSGLNGIAMIQTHFLATVEGWWWGARALVKGQVPTAVVAIGIVIAALAWWRIRAGGVAAGPDYRRLLIAGAATFLLGHATFLIVPSIAFTSTGMGNRVHVAAAIGAAIIFASIIAFGAGLMPARIRATAFATVMAMVTLTSFVRLSTVENYWAEAPMLQERVLAAARADLRDLPADSTVILDGVCPYHGPAVVFETNWDVGGAFTLALHRPISGDMVSPRMRLTEKGLETSIYKEPSFYPYGQQLYVYDPGRHFLARLGDAHSARRYFAGRKGGTCPGFVARGVEV